MSKDIKNPSRIDLHVGARVRMRRKMLNISQERLAGALNLTFQQIQKYERGANRISASKLYEIARTLQVPIAFFFEGLADHVEVTDEAADTANRILSDFLGTPEGLELAEVFPRLGKGQIRRQILDLVRAIAGPPTPKAAS